jgi:hypothetical protein
MFTPPNYLSPSSIRLFRDCPQKFKLSKFDKIQEPPTWQQYVGTFVHDVLEHLYQVDADERTVGFLQALADDAVKVTADQVIIVRNDKGTDPVSGTEVTVPADAEEVVSNNRLRGELDAAMAGELAPLKMERAVFRTDLSPQQPGPEGQDEVTFTVATNPGAPAGPLNRIASGGELSRFLLALKVCLTGQTPGLTMIFDEIDRGVGGVAVSPRRGVADQLSGLTRKRVPSSRAPRASLSEASRSKSNTSRFSARYAGLAARGITTLPDWTLHRMSTCAGDLP